MSSGHFDLEIAGIDLEPSSRTCIFTLLTGIGKILSKLPQKVNFAHALAKKRIIFLLTQKTKLNTISRLFMHAMAATVCRLFPISPLPQGLVTKITVCRTH